ncbi:SidE phosphodiesterase domain-containing protein [Legionella pneumophila serogroup 1]|uniref:SidE phosphodiesterase domain-containing protein n=4 Tax=Legionella pneumophila TaxID=446 RepID=UPI000770A635|nr:SidE phosphodiesterase domain-containing protein [Legionella pneumophila]HAT8823300.1 NAD-dependent ubiquitin ligase [Legionella pneumophila subsp. pneumophila]MCZ4739154.1 SidE phosphodiesterase domain-containing protein [Legionella pneumophila]MCZ4747770.1 SidE phosphodiesterase domain-containing protein [Legionella pneumophila]MDI9829496.1 SidE phosphodiesterase domain-containing protein [Legionella pneumophila]MDO5175854.1 SidE phosphodiesterase domain-containing protein [Legionella pne
MPKYVEGVELTQEGMHAIFARMGHGDITSGSIYNGVPTIDTDALNRQGFMPVLTGVGPRRDSGHWIMLIKGPGNQYFLFDPLGKTSGEGYKNTLLAQLPIASTLSVIPNNPGLNMGLCGYWVASVGLKARAELNKDNPPDLETLGRTTTEEMRNELTDNGYLKITGWLRAVSDKFPAGDPQPDAKTLRETTEKDLHIEIPSPVPPVKDTAPKEVSTKPTAPQVAPKHSLDSKLLENDEDVLDTIKYVHKEYLGKPYPGPLKNPKAPEEGRLPPNEGPDRGPHGLAHTVRTMACAEVMIEEARKAQLRGETLGKAKNGQTLADVTPEELKKILIAQAFFVVGRDDERSGYDDVHKRNFYAEYHEKSEQAFRKYVEDNKLIGKIFKDQKEVDFYAAIILDKNHEWDASPAHILINQGHMVDLMRTKAPAEVALERTYNTLKYTLGSKGAEVVLKAHRDFFFVTGAVVPLVNPEAIDDPSRGGPYENPYSGEKFVIVDDKVPASKKDLPKAVNRDYKLKDNERFLTIKEYYAFPDVQQTYPGYKTRLEGSSYYFPTPFAGECEHDPAKCLGAIQKARSKLQTDAIKNGFQSSSDKERRQPNMDEIAAARIIQQIMANPDCIGNDHVSINGQELGEKFFRDLLAKCDMAVVGSLLNDTDIKNIDTLMRHEKDTEFHSTDPQAVPVKIGDAWENRIRTKGGDVTQMKHDLIFLMQNDAWYFSRVNAIAQNRDKGSNFKEVLFTALMTPLTNKSLMDTSHVPAPKKLYRGLNLPQEFTNKLINQSNAIIANTENTLFTDLSAEAFKQIKLNDFSQMSGKTCASTTKNMKLLTDIWGSNVIFEMLDPDGLLHPKQVGTHMAGSEDEFSVYLPEDVALVPTKVTLEGKTDTGEDRYIFTLVAVKSPDFIPRHESGYAVEPFMKMQKEKVTQALDAIEKDKGSYNIDEQLKNLRIEMVRQAKLPLREGIFDRLSHRLSLETSDNKISPERRDFLNQHVIPVLQECHIALRTNNMEMMQNALAKFPTDKQWSAFKSGEAVRAKAQMDVLKQQIEKKIMLQTQIIPALTECGEALDKQNATEALQALNKLPAEKEIGKVKTIGQELRGQIVDVKQELTGNLEPLQRAVTTPVVKDAEKMRVRYETLVTDVTKRVTDFEKIKPANLGSYNKAIADLNNIQQELTLLRNEKIRMHTDKDKAVDFSDIEALEKRLQETQPKLLTQLLEQTSKDVAKLVKIPEKLTFTIIKSMTSKIKEQMDILELARNERIKQHGTSTEPLDMSDLDKLKGELQTLNQNLVDDLLEDIKDSLSNIKDIATFEEESKYIEKCLDHLTGLEQTLDGSEKAIKQKEDISTYRKALIDKQEKAYPEMVQLQYKSEGLIMQLRDLCNAHHENVAETTKARLQQLENKNSEGGLLGGLWTVTNTLGLTTDTVHVEKMQIRMKEQVLRGFKTGLNNDKQNVDQIIGFLAKKKPSELEEGLGISKENATELYGLLQQLDSKTASIDKLQENAKLIDEISTKIGREPIKHDHVITMVEEENDDMRYGF